MLFTLVIGAARAAAAGPTAVVLEAHGAPRPSNTDALLAPVYAELTGKGFVSGAPLSSLIDHQLSLTGDTLDAAAISRLTDGIDAGYARFLQGDFDAAAPALEAAQALLTSRPATVARTQSLRDSVIKLQMGLALTYQRQGRVAESTAVLAEFLRSFPDKEISRAKYGPEPAQLAKKVREELAARPTGTLRVQVEGNRGGTIFVQERYIGVKSASLTDLFAGRYRVYVQTDTPGRVHEIEVTPGSDQTLAIRWGLDSTLRTDGWVGFQFEDERERIAGESTNVSEVGQKVGAKVVVVLGIRDIEGRKAVVGAVVETSSGRTDRAAAVAIEPMGPSANQLRALGRFLAGGEPEPGLVLVKEVPSAAVATPPEVPRGRTVRRAWFKDTWGWSLVGSGLAVAGVGAGFLISGQGLADDAASEPDDATALDLYSRSDSRITTGAILVPVGAAVIVAGILKFTLGRPVARKEKSPGGVRVGAGTLSWEGTF